MLEKYSYINIYNSNSAISEKVETLFVTNKQQKRYEHVLLVAKQIDIIAIQYGLDREKCRISAMLHDIGTLINRDDMLSYAKNNLCKLCVAEISHPFLLHQRFSEIVAQEDFGVTDSDILEAIAFHTSLCENASQYQMALFVADKLSWSQDEYPPFYKQMLNALSYSLEDSCYEYIKYMESNGEMPSIHSDWAKAVSWIKNILQHNEKI